MNLLIEGPDHCAGVVKQRTVRERMAFEVYVTSTADVIVEPSRKLAGVFDAQAAPEDIAQQLIDSWNQITPSVHLNIKRKEAA